MAISVKENWMSTVVSPTYNLTLYAVSANLYADPTPLKNDANVLGSEAIIIAKSGVTTGYSLENVTMMGKPVALSGSNVVDAIYTDVSFDIYEPFGNYLPERLAYCSNIWGAGTAMSVLFMLKIEFMAYHPITHRPITSSTTAPGPFFLALRPFDIQGSYTLEGSTYTFACGSPGRYGATASEVPRDISFSSGSTVSAFLDGLQDQLNTYELSIVEDGVPMRKWVIDKSNLDASLLRASINNYSDKTTDSVASDPSNVEKLLITKQAGISVSKFIEQMLINNVPYYRDLVKKADDNTATTKKPIIEVKLSQITEQGEKATVIDSTLELQYTYQIDVLSKITQASTKSTPEKEAKVFESSAGVNDVNTCKVYNYLYTGKNTEVLSAELRMNNIFRAALYPKKYAAQSRTVVAVNNNRQSDTTPRLQSNKTSPTKVSFNGLKYLEDLKLPQNNELIKRAHMISRRVDQAPLSEQTTENSNTTDDYMHLEAVDFYKYVQEQQTLALSIIGDPYWLGIPDIVTDEETNLDYAIVNNQHGDNTFVFLNYRVNETVAKPGKPDVPDIDFITSGAYLLTEITANFQGGSFTMDIKATKIASVNPYALSVIVSNLNQR